MYSDSLVRQLCAEIAAANDHEKAIDLISLLQAVIKEDQEEIRVRMAFLSNKYAEVISGSKAADQTHSPFGPPSILFLQLHRPTFINFPPLLCPHGTRRRIKSSCISLNYLNGECCYAAAAGWAS